MADLQKCLIKNKTKKHCCLCPIIEYFGISVPFRYYSLLGRVIDFPSRVRVVKKIPSTGRVASTRHSLPAGHSSKKLWPKIDLWNFAHVFPLYIKN